MIQKKWWCLPCRQGYVIVIAPLKYVPLVDRSLPDPYSSVHEPHSNMEHAVSTTLLVFTCEYINLLSTYFVNSEILASWNMLTLLAFGWLFIYDINKKREKGHT